MATRSTHVAPRHAHAREVSLTAVGLLDWLIIASGLAALLLSLGRYYTYRLDVVSVVHQNSTNAWNGTFGWLAAFLAMLGSAVLAAGLMIPALRGSNPLRITVLALYLLALVSVVVAFFVVPKGRGDSYVVFFAQQDGHGLAYWFSLLVIAFGATLSAVQFLHHRPRN